MKLNSDRFRRSIVATASAELVVLSLMVFCSPAAVADDDLALFESQVRPLLVEHCYECHSGENAQGGLSLDSRDGWQRGGDSGPALLANKPDESLLIRAVLYDDADLAMPPSGKLPEAAIATLVQWVRRGAPDPRIGEARIGGMTEAEAQAWWAFQPLPLADQPLSAALIDRFIDAALASAGLSLSPPADKTTLIRRAALDLTGLPPTAEAVESFRADNSPNAFGRVVETLLQSPQYGEKWGRHWLDTVRYADSLDARGIGGDGDIRDAWRYRDWVVDAFNRDLPYDAFITHQLAGDILAAEQWDPQLVTATGMYAIGNWGNGDADKEKVHTDIVDDQIDVTGRAFLGLTLACARCHDHKFDAITTHDYYALAGIFFSSSILEQFAAKGAGENPMRIALLSPEQQAERQQLSERLAAVHAALAAALNPFTQVTQTSSGIAGLITWFAPSEPNPCVVINTTPEPVAFSTVKLPPRAISVHPGPTIPVSVSWRSPIATTVYASARLIDADPNCGDGITWTLRHAETVLLAGVVDNGGSSEVPETSIAVQAGDLVQLAIGPRGEYTCDSTQVEFVIRDDKGSRWSLHEDVVSSGTHGEQSRWWLCAGEGGALHREGPQHQLLAEERAQLEQQLSAMQHYAHGLREGGISGTIYEGFHDVAIHKRGRYDQLGDVVPRGIPQQLTNTQPNITSGSGRLQLAHWIASADHPLTARVMVNRIWQHHFGEGLVRTPNNFGKLGALPTHPELLDALAAEFIQAGWSIKHMHRLIMSTAAYQRSSIPTAAAKQIDPDNLLLSHQQLRRLSAEELRDAMLAVSGALELRIGGPSTNDVTSPRRTLYLTTIRSDRSSFQALFDGADPTAIVEKRTEATTAPQSLFLLNHPLPLQQAQRLAAAALERPGDGKNRLAWLWRRVFLTEPTQEEAEMSFRFLGDSPDARQWAGLCQMLLCSNRFTYVE